MARSWASIARRIFLMVRVTRKNSISAPEIAVLKCGTCSAPPSVWGYAGTNGIPKQRAQWRCWVRKSCFIQPLLALNPMTRISTPAACGGARCKAIPLATVCLSSPAIASGPKMARPFMATASLPTNGGTWWRNMARRKAARWLPASIWIRPASTAQAWASSATVGRSFTGGWLRMSKGWDYGDWIDGFAKSPLSRYSDLKPWGLTEKSEAIVVQMIEQLQSDYSIKNNVAIAHSAIVEDGAIIKGPAIIGPQSFIASGAYIRGGCWM